jgi:hypothetical protein
MNDEDHREDEMGENAGNEGPQKLPPSYFVYSWFYCPKRKCFSVQGECFANCL